MDPLVHRLLSASATIIAVAGLALAVPACSSSKSSGGSSTATEAPEDQIVSAAQVSEGLIGIQQLNSTAVLTLPRDQAGAQATVNRAYDLWYTIEGTVKHNDIDAYLGFEDALGSLKNGVDQNDVNKATVAAATFASKASAYLNQWPAQADGTGTSVTTASTTP